MAKAAKKSYESTDEYKRLRADLLDDLSARGLIAAVYVDKAEEYLKLWCWLQMLDEDIRRRGVFVEYSNGATQKGQTDNKSLAIATRVSAQMLSIFGALGFKDHAQNAKAADCEEDEL